MNATTVAVDLAKSVFQLAVADASWRVVETHRLSRTQFERWFAEHRIPATMGIAFVKASKLADGLDVVHESMLWQGSTLLHASSLSGRVVTLPWRRFLEESGERYDGFVLFEYR